VPGNLNPNCAEIEIFCLLLKHRPAYENVIWRIRNLSTRGGKLGEQSVEDWLARKGWHCCERNMRVSGGEIDRLFVRYSDQDENQIDVCVAEVKTTKIQSQRQFRELFSEARLRPLIRPHQIRNLWRTAAIYESRLKSRRRRTFVRTFVRYFLVVYASESLIKFMRAGLRSGDIHAPLRLCCVGERELILAWSPDAPTQKL